MSRGVLIVTYAFPPSRSVAAVRWGVLSKYLARLGFEITVITSRLAGGLPQPEVPRVIRPADLESPHALRSLLRRPGDSAGKARSAEKDAAAAWTKLVVPDGWLLTWVPFALLAARREIRAGRVDCIVTTSPAESTHLVGLAARRLGPAWVADFRDGWIFEPARPAFGPRALDSLDRRLESAVVASADGVTAVTEELAAYFRGHADVDALCIPNGWDPELGPGKDHGSRRRSVSWKARLVYTGTLGAGTTPRRPEPLFAALNRFHEREPDLAARLELVVAGRQTARDAALLSSVAGRYLVVKLGELPREDAAELQRSADALLLCNYGWRASLKLYEYLAAGRPILHLGDDGAAARILRETGSGVTVPADDVDGIVDRLREIARGDFGSDLQPHGIEQYSYPFLAERMAEVIEEAVQHRQARR